MLIGIPAAQVCSYHLYNHPPVPIYSIPAKNLEGKIQFQPAQHLFWPEATPASRTFYMNDGIEKLYGFPRH